MSDQPTDTSAVNEAAEADHDVVSGDVPGRDGGPTDGDDMAAADGLTASPGVQEEYSDMLDRGAKQKGEGRVP